MRISHGHISFPFLSLIRFDLILAYYWTFLPQLPHLLSWLCCTIALRCFRISYFYCLSILFSFPRKPPPFDLLSSPFFFPAHAPCPAPLMDFNSTSLSIIITEKRKQDSHQMDLLSIYHILLVYAPHTTFFHDLAGILFVKSIRSFTHEKGDILLFFTPSIGLSTSPRTSPSPFYLPARTMDYYYGLWTLSLGLSHRTLYPPFILLILASF